MITPLGQIQGVPDELIRALNDRFRQVSTSSGAAAIAGARQTRIKSYPASDQNPGDFFVEMDRGNALYQVQVGKWLLVSGAMAGALAKRPTDLNSGDVGFIYFATDTAQEFRWSGSAWVEVSAPGNEVQRAFASGSLSLVAGVDNDVTGATLTLNRAGKYLIIGCFDFLVSSLDTGVGMIGKLMADGVTQTGVAYYISQTAAERSVVSQVWFYNAATAGLIAKLRAQKLAGGGTSSCVGGASTTGITAVWIAP
jgi:hypothetical protein